MELLFNTIQPAELKFVNTWSAAEYAIETIHNDNGGDGGEHRGASNDGGNNDNNDGGSSNGVASELEYLVFDRLYDNHY